MTATTTHSPQEQEDSGRLPCWSLDDQAHADLVRAIVAHFHQHPRVTTFCEVPYNHYGQRGVIDIVILVQPSPSDQWHGIACEVKPVLRDIGATLRQVRKAQLYFSMPQHTERYGTPRLRYPLILAATESNYITALTYASILDGIEIHFFDAQTAFNNPYENNWQQAFPTAP